jgi:hypothetical protein
MIRRGAPSPQRSVSSCEEQLRWLWEERVFDRTGVGERFAQLALVRGRGAEAAALVNKIWSFTAFPGLAKKLDAVIAEYPLDDELLALAATALLRAGATSSNAQERWGLAAFLLHSEEDRFLEAVLSAAYGFLNPFNPFPGAAGRLCDIIDTYGRTHAAAVLSTRVRALSTEFPQQ